MRYIFSSQVWFIDPFDLWNWSWYIYLFLVGADDHIRIIKRKIDFVDSMAYKLHLQGKRSSLVFWSWNKLKHFCFKRNVYRCFCNWPKCLWSKRKKKPTVPSNLNTKVNELKKMTQTGDLSGNIGGLSIKILTSRGCLGATCDTLLFNVTANDNGMLF